jgi:Condensin II complex subunit CAP-H2 or CNDH2, N-terminal
LDEYLEDLEFSQETRERIVHAASNNNSNFNFAQAAIVLQNSSGIYSRKVDYLYSSVYKVQDELISTFHQNGQPSNKKGNKKNVGVDSDIEEFLNFDPHQEFLPLNDVIPTCDLNENGHKINLAVTDTSDYNLDTTFMSTMTTKVRGSFIADSASRRRHRTSLGSTTLFADRTMMTEGVRMMNIASRRALLGTLDTTGTLRLQAGVCDIGDDGILRIPGSSSQERDKEDLWDNDIHQGTDLPNGSFSAVDLHDGIIDDDNDTGGFVMADDDNERSPQEGLESTQGERKRVTFSDRTAALTVPIHLQEKRKDDPWALLDRDSPDGRKPRPLRIGKTIVLPSTVDKLPSECVTGARTRQVARIKQLRIPRRKLAQSSLDNTDTFNANTCGKKRALQRNHFSKTGSTYGNEFAYIAKAMAQHKAEERREQRLQTSREQHHNSVITQPAEMEVVEDSPADFGGFCLDHDDEDYEYGGNDDNVFSDDVPVESNTGIASMDGMYHNRDTGGKFFT